MKYRYINLIKKIFTNTVMYICNHILSEEKRWYDSKSKLYFSPNGKQCVNACILIMPKESQNELKMIDSQSKPFILYLVSNQEHTHTHTQFLTVRNSFTTKCFTLTRLSG